MQNENSILLKAAGRMDGHEGVRECFQIRG